MHGEVHRLSKGLSTNRGKGDAAWKSRVWFLMRKCAMQTGCFPLMIATNSLVAQVWSVCCLPMGMADATKVVVIGETSTSCGSLHAC
jgi:hypothetical protein